jgi:hypothetical protein
MSPESTKPSAAVINWLLDSDPAIRWQVMRDLTHESGPAIAAERTKVATQGWGAEILGRQNPNGTWGDGKDAPVWLSTLQALQLLWNMGVDPASEQARHASALLHDKVVWISEPGWDLRSRPEVQGEQYFVGEVEPCINGRILGYGAYFGHPNKELLARLLSETLADGGWNCDAERGSVRSSFHSTICVLEGLLEYQLSVGADPAIQAALTRAHEYMLSRRMFRSLTTGEMLDKAWLKFSYPTTWHYDLLRGLDHFRAAGVKPDPRMAEAIELLKSKQDKDGRWPRENIHSDPLKDLAMEGAVGTPSRWNTLRALRVLDWYSQN